MLGLVFPFLVPLCPQKVCSSALCHRPPASILIHFTIFSPLFILLQNSQSEEEEDVFGILRRRSSLGLSGHPLTEEGLGTGGLLSRPLRRIISIEEDPLPQLLGGGSEQPLGQCPEEAEAFDQGAEGQIGPSRPLELMPASPRGQPVGKETPSKVRVHPSLACRSPCALSLECEPKSPKATQEARLSRPGDAASLCPSGTTLLCSAERPDGDSGVWGHSPNNFCCWPLCVFL